MCPPLPRGGSGCGPSCLRGGNASFAFIASSAIIAFTASIASAPLPHRAVPSSPVPFRTATQRNAKQSNATQRNATQHNATQRSAAQRNATQHNATQHNATQHTWNTPFAQNGAGGGLGVTSRRYALWIHSVPCGCALWPWRGQWAGGRSQ